MGCLQSKNKHDSDTQEIKIKITEKEQPMAHLNREELIELSVLRNRKDQSLRRLPGQLNGLNVSIDTMENCSVQILDWTEQITCDDLSGCEVVFGPCEGAVFIRNCKNCTFYICSQQLRTRDCSDCKIFLYTKTRPVIELSHHLHIGSWNCEYPKMEELFNRCLFDPLKNECYEIHDFNECDPDIPTPHWSKMTADEILKGKLTIKLEGEEWENIKISNPVPLPEASLVDEEEIQEEQKEDEEVGLGDIELNL